MSHSVFNLDCSTTICLNIVASYLCVFIQLDVVSWLSNTTSWQQKVIHSDIDEDRENSYIIYSIKIAIS